MFYLFLSAIDFMARLERTDAGYIAYKVFALHNTPRAEWKIEPGAIIEEVVN